DVRVIATSNRNLTDMVSLGEFRQDLYFRLKGIELFIPPLRTRHEDILLLADSFLNSPSSADGSMTLSNDSISALLQHNWPGNVRELQQMIHAAAALCEEGPITPSDLGLMPDHSTPKTSQFEPYLDLPLTEARSQLVEDFERQVIERALETESHNVSAAARRLGIHRQSLQQKMKQLGIR
ncbi:MAG: sigma-54-dependent Fis family transcriptional regulator, partial [Fuerstiella sp.]|nr:sigma-54-dependent Fis family transcriptional regulator [Fuerstiella sp.]